MDKKKKTDTSPQVYQKEKINWELKIRELPWSKKQNEYISCVADKHTKVLFLRGPAGTSKTTVAVRGGLELLNQKKVSDIIFVRAAVESGDSKLGMLPGDIEHKVGEYMTPFDDKLEELLSKGDISKLKAEKRLIYKPVNFCRGASWTAKCVIVDEAQNMTLNEIQTLMTRIGMFSKIILCADPEQSDIPSNKQGGFDTAARIFSSEAAAALGIHSLAFDKTDIVRSPLCQFVVETFEAYKKAKNSSSAQ
jgi:phosphate starvation-inducible PhoH-like protein